jgi:CRP/FNR family cyclic AMP-dependent transcriptional regulator
VAITPDQLKNVPLFAALPDKDLKSLANSLRERTFPAGGVVVEEGKSGVGFFLIESGEATVTRGGNAVRKLGPGDYFGEIALIAETPRSATITADTDLLCHGLTPWDFKPLVEANGSIAWALLETLARRLAEAQ